MIEMFWFFMIPLKLMIAFYIAYRVTSFLVGLV
jgi:hypothetical protein